MYFDLKEYLLTLIVGGRDTGKTTFVTGDISLQLTGLMQEYWENKYQCIIICDTKPDHPKYAHVPLVTFEQFKSRGGITKGVIRICMRDFTEFIAYCVSHPIKNALFIFEDARKYVPTKWDKTPWMDFALDSKQNHIDAIFMFHVWGWIPPDLARLCDRVELFKTVDTPQERKQYIGGLVVPAMQAHERVTRNKNQHYHETIDNRS